MEYQQLGISPGYYQFEISSAIPGLIFCYTLLSVIFCHSISNGFSVQFWYLWSDFLLDSSNIHTSQSTPSTSRLTKQGYQINIYFELKNIEMDFLETFYIDMLKLVVICLHFRNEDICHLLFVYIFLNSFYRDKIKIWILYSSFYKKVGKKQNISKLRFEL